MIVVTGAAGFIGSCLLSRLNKEGINDIILVDDFSHDNKTANYKSKKYSQLIERSQFIEVKKTSRIEYGWGSGALLNPAPKCAARIWRSPVPIRARVSARFGRRYRLRCPRPRDLRLVPDSDRGSHAGALGGRCAVIGVRSQNPTPNGGYR